nr:hypothetical protein GCM10020185_78370 [Pseudomonas brassicacearum subsp. brassicacearum]
MAVADDHDANQLSKTLWERGLTDWHWTHPTFVFSLIRSHCHAPYHPRKKDIQLSDLDAWGTVADLGSQILEGEVKAFGKMTFGAPHRPHQQRLLRYHPRQVPDGLPLRRTSHRGHR